MNAAQVENQIGVVGAGLIGMSWAGLFSAFGYETTVYDPYLKEPYLAHQEINDIWGSLDLLFDGLKNKKGVKFSDKIYDLKPNSSAFFAAAIREILEDAITLTSFLKNLGSSSEGIFMFSFSKYSLIFVGIPIL